ncbi:hypothetical protein KUCAC02_030829 [Chaenocephalus aceratus]|uniref:Uncharacterized protein n=1 Tax=Chaenocephalus aceratus TaxID=36190 RepID=A0ACB9XMC8_CHAAC|nr:hypothetical protein KUCAC02_030829 [Chaenocephalus aceratus]
MSKPCPPVRGPKPPVAPKPSPPQRLSNGDLDHSDGETEELQEMAGENQDKEEERDAEDGVHDNGSNDIEEVAGGEIEEKKEKEVDILDNDCDSVGSEDTVKADDSSTVETTEEENTDNDLNQLEGVIHTDENTSTPSPPLAETKDETGEEAEEEEKRRFRENSEIVNGSSGHSNKHVEENNLGEKDNDTGLNEADEQSDDTLNCGLHTDDTELEDGGFAFGFSVLPTVTEEYPYDVIGPTDDASDTCESCDTVETGEIGVWQPERATKDLSGCFRFTSSTEDVFGPYSVIGSLSPDVTDTADPEWSQDDADDKPSIELQTEAATNQEPYYMSSDDVDKLDDKQALSELGDIEEGTEQTDQQKDKEKASESADEYCRH